MVRRIALDGAETTWPGLLLLPGFLAGFSRDGGDTMRSLPKISKNFQNLSGKFFRYDIIKNYLISKTEKSLPRGQAKTQQIKTLGGN